MEIFINLMSAERRVPLSGTAGELASSFLSSSATQRAGRGAGHLGEGCGTRSSLPCAHTFLPARWYYIVVVPAEQSPSSPTARWRTPDEMELDQVGA